MCMRTAVASPVCVLQQLTLPAKRFNRNRKGRFCFQEAALFLLLDHAYSYLRDSTGSSCAARVAGTVPKITPTSVAAANAMMTESQLTGNL